MDRTRLARTTLIGGLAGLPLWWVLGLATLVPLVVGAVLALDLATRRAGPRTVPGSTGLRFPSGSGWWALFLVWVALGVLVLWATAPGADPGGGAGRLLVFGYRLSWYLTATVVLVWLGNTPRQVLSDRAVHRVVAAVFVTTVAGGFLGILQPDLSLTTPASQLLPGGLRGNEFVSGLVAAEAADVQTVLGDPAPRPKAPFAYTNTWGSVLALAAPFFVVALLRERRRIKVPAAALGLLAVVPVVLSLNRGLWLSLGVAVGVLLAVLLVRRRAAAAVLAACLLAGFGAAALSPLAEVYSARLDNPHSNERRSQLLSATVHSASTGSPVVGFGGTRDVAGSFSSIAGGATTDCPACAPPPLGTQGQLWLVLFSQGWPGLVFFGGFLLVSLVRNLRCRTVNQVVTVLAIGMFLVQLPVYDTLGLPLVLVLMAVGLSWRESLADAPVPAAVRTTVPEPRRRRRVLALAAVGGFVGAVTGIGVTAAQATPTTAATVSVLLTPPPTYLDVGPVARALAPAGETTEPRAATIDTEAALALSDATLIQAAREVGGSTADLRGRVTVAAPPLSSVLDVTATATDGDAAGVAAAVADSYLVEREAFLSAQRDELVRRLTRELAGTRPGPGQAPVRQYLQAAIDHLSSHRPGVGRVIRQQPVRVVPAGRAVPGASGLALGLLAGVALAGITTTTQRLRGARS